MRAHRLLGVLVAMLLVSVLSATAQAQDQLPPQTGEPTPQIIPRPNSGQEPVDAGDRGGSLQLLVLSALVIAVAGGVLTVLRQSRRARSASS